MEERRPIWRVAANKLNKESRTADKRWSPGLMVERSAKNLHRKKVALLRNGYICFGPGLILWCKMDLQEVGWGGRGTEWMELAQGRTGGRLL